MTPLQHAVFSGNLPVVRYLLDHGADLHQEGNLEGHDGLTALHTAALKGINTKKTSLMSSSSGTRAGYLFSLYCYLLILFLFFGGYTMEHI